MSRLVVALLALCLVVGPATAVVGAQDDGATATNATATDATATPAPTPELGACAGTVTEPADGVTVVSVQGARFQPEVRKTTPRLVAFGPRGNVRWVYEPEDAAWSYDIDPLPNGDLFLTAAVRVDGEGRTRLVRFDPTNQSVVWTETLALEDTHDADLLDEHRVAIANMRNADPANGTNGDRLLVYNRTSDAVEWEWRFDGHYPRGTGGDYGDDWTHVNDIDPVRGGEAFLASPRNLDQVVLVNRSTGEIDLRLGRDDDRSTLYEQHNPQLLQSEDGRPTLLVGDSENDRIVEYALREGADPTAGTAGQGGAWERTWTLGSERSFDWPRDADRLANGNTLVADSRNHRAVEVTPQGEVVWEVYAPWLVYDVARVPDGNEGGGPTIADRDAGGEYRLTGDAEFDLDRQEACAETLNEAAGRGTFLVSGGAVRDLAERAGSTSVGLVALGLLLALGAGYRLWT